MRWFRCVRGAKTKVVSTVGFVAVAAPVLFAVTAAFAATKPPAPKILSGPSGATTSTKVSFSYRDSLATATFLCGLDTTRLKACRRRGTMYAGLAAGVHTFRVAVRARTGAVSKTTSRTWAIDLSGPVHTLTFPVNGAVYGPAAWNAGCSAGAGVCGTASDPNGVVSVGVAVQRLSTRRYWNGRAFASPTVAALMAVGTTSWRLPLPLPSDGRYRVWVEATDALGNVAPLTELVQARIDTAVPASPTFSAAPRLETPDTTAQIAFTDRDTDPGLTSACSLDDAPLSPCSSPLQFTNLAIGSHQVQVVAFDSAHNASTPAVRNWTVVVGEPFMIDGDLSGALAPGVTRQINLSFRNPNDFTISVISATIAVDDTTMKDGQPNPACAGNDNLVVLHGLSGRINVPANSTATLAELGVPSSLWPAVQMPDRNVNQDGCKGASFALTYSGVAEQS